MRLLLAVLLAAVVGCESLPPVEVCYTHPTYGAVCVQINGKKHFREDLTPEQRAEVEKWVKEKEAR